MNRHSGEEKAQAWMETAKTVEDHSNELVDQWNKEVDGLLTFVCVPAFLCYFARRLTTSNVFCRQDFSRPSLRLS